MEDSKLPAAATTSAESTTTATTKPDDDDLSPTNNNTKKVKPVLKKHPADGTDGERPKKELKWDEEIIEEHDLLRGTRMKIEEPNTPYTHYDSHSDGNESDGSVKRPKSPAETQDEKVLSWDELHVKLKDVADNYPSSPSSQGGAVEERKHQEFVEHRKHHYNEMEMVRKFREQHSSLDEDDGDEENDADDDMDMK